MRLEKISGIGQHLPSLAEDGLSKQWIGQWVTSAARHGRVMLSLRVRSVHTNWIRDSLTDVSKILRHASEKFPHPISWFATNSAGFSPECIRFWDAIAPISSDADIPQQNWDSRGRRRGAAKKEAFLEANGARSTDEV
jgi:hypothetical protein